MHVPADKVHVELDVNLYRRLLKLEEQEKLDQIKDHLHQQGALPPAVSAAAAGEAGDGSSSGLGLGGSRPGNSSFGQQRDADAAWGGLMQSAPWLQGSSNSSSSSSDEAG
jgi:hypothetical protein